MNAQDRRVATAIFAMMLVLWLGFLVHRSPFFAGSLPGSAFGILGAIFMLVPLAYAIVKRNARLRRVFIENNRFGVLLRAHIYFGLAGALLAIIHSGHKFQSPLGIALTTAMLLSVLTGFFGQYYLRYVAEDLREKKTQLDGLRRSLDVLEQTYAVGAEASGAAIGRAAGEFLHLASATADLQHSIQFQERIRRASKAWLTAHITFSILFYLLLVLHVWAGIYFGLRWVG
tara:strand:- start:6062 stop:6751 length:690 start_codon:yes stop_codon:yes gene_type:complete